MTDDGGHAAAQPQAVGCFPSGAGDTSSAAVGQKRATDEIFDSGAPESKRGRVDGSAAEANAGQGQEAGVCQAAADSTPNNAAGVASSSTALTSLAAAFSEDKGCRNTMEDISVIEMDAKGTQGISTCRLAFFGVFDGHGGSACATIAAQSLMQNVLDKGLLKCLKADGAKVDVKAAKQAVVEGYRATDDAVLKECKAKNLQDGACAVTVWVFNEAVLVANVGDGKCVLARRPEQDKSGQVKAITLTKEHTALLERQRIEKAGGVVSADGRLNGRIQISRSFGDLAFKGAGCICTPDVQAFELTPRDELLLCGCDGFWSVFSPQDAVETALKLLAEGKDAKSVTNRLLNMAVRERRCKDNCSVLLVRFECATRAKRA